MPASKLRCRDDNEDNIVKFVEGLDELYIITVFSSGYGVHVLNVFKLKIFQKKVLFRYIPF